MLQQWQKRSGWIHPSHVGVIFKDHASISVQTVCGFFLRDKSQNLRVFAPNRNLLGLKNYKRRKKVRDDDLATCWMVLVGSMEAEGCWQRGQLASGPEASQRATLGLVFCCCCSLLLFFVIIVSIIVTHRASLGLVLVVILCHYCCYCYHLWRAGSNREKNTRVALLFNDNNISCLLCFNIISC